jgi:hypothetical protein
MRIVYGLPEGGGWHPITHMVRLLAELLEAELVVVPLSRPANAWRRVAGLGPRRRGRETCLVVAAAPAHLNTLLRADYWRRGYRHVAGWVIDSFWVDRIPSSVRRRSHFDQLFVADKEVVGLWQAETGLPVTWLPWGSDVLQLGSAEADRPVDVQRLGRQPSGWEDDDATRRACEGAGLRFEGRPPMHDDATANQAALMRSLSQAKFVLAFSNAVSPAPYTHPTREYLTGRWTDALASGATAAGIAPRCAATDELLWPGALLELPTTERGPGIEQIAAAVESWDPQTALDNHRHALERLDWRWRFRELAAALQIESARLDSALESLVEATAQVRSS